MAKQHIIELNGKRYDTLTGKVVASSPIKPSALNKTKSSAAKVPASLDGFAPNGKPRTVTANHIPARKTERSKTLMRGAVQKPAQIKASIANHSSRIQASASAAAAHTAVKIPKAIHKSALIRRFNDMMPASGSQTSQSTNRTSLPKSVQAVAATATVVSNSKTNKLSEAEAPAHSQARRTKLSTRVAKKLRISPKSLSALSLVLAVILFGGFFTYQNAPSLSMRLASTRAGLQGNIPKYQPVGFGLTGGISYRPGQIELSYKSDTDNRNFKIIQTSSTWNSETLAQNYEPLKQSANYQTVPNKGKTVYIYNGDNATWVDGGIWYRIEGQSKLSSDQLLNVADSL